MKLNSGTASHPYDSQNDMDLASATDWSASATPGDVGALGLHYQWGRKDPFMGSSSISSSEIAKSTITWPTPAQSNASRGTIDFAIANPTVFISGNGINYDWYYSGNHKTENSRWAGHPLSARGLRPDGLNIGSQRETHTRLSPELLWIMSDDFFACECLKTFRNKSIIPAPQL